MADRSREQYFEQKLKSGATFLGRWAGADAELAELTRSHRTARVLLTRDKPGENLLISCLEPVRIEAPIRWSNASLSITRASLSSDDEGFLISDPNGRVSILCGAVEFAENVKR